MLRASHVLSLKGGLEVKILFLFIAATGRLQSGFFVVVVFSIQQTYVESLMVFWHW